MSSNNEEASETDDLKMSASGNHSGDEESEGSEVSEGDDGGPHKSEVSEGDDACNSDDVRHGRKLTDMVLLSRSLEASPPSAQSEMMEIGKLDDGTVVHMSSGKYNLEKATPEAEGKHVYVFSDGNGDILWYLDGELHNDDGPAVLLDDGQWAWYVRGKLHRDDGPALVNNDGTEVWYRQGQLHRKPTEGPAIVRDGVEEFWYRGVKIPKNATRIFERLVYFTEQQH